MENSPRFVSGPTLGYDQAHDGPNNYHTTVNWATDVPTIFVTGFNRNSSKLSSGDPTQWINEWGGTTNWSNSYQNSGRSATYQPIYGQKYYFRVASKDQNGKMVISGNQEIYLPAVITPTPKPNCCGYNTAFQKWYCYTGCTGANPDVTTLYPNQTCQVASTCHY